MSPLNDTYAAPLGLLPIVFALSTHPFQPALASTLQLHFSYLLLDHHNGSHALASGDFDLGKLSSTSIENPYFIIGYSDKLAGLESQFELQCYVSSMVGFPSTDNNSTGDNKQATLVTNPNIMYNTYFTTQSGAHAADVPSQGSNGACLPHAGRSMAFNVSEYIEIKSHTYGVLSRNSPTIEPLPCAMEVDAATAASITAGMATATTTTASLAHQVRQQVPLESCPAPGSWWRSGAS